MFIDYLQVQNATCCLISDGFHALYQLLELNIEDNIHCRMIIYRVKSIVNIKSYLVVELR